jgi:hypothetical protein
MLKDYPIKNDSREQLVLYICELHNHINKRLSKPIFDCSKAMAFWGGDCGCEEKDQKENMPDKEYQKT